MSDKTNPAFGECRNCGLLLETTCLQETGVEGIFCGQVCLGEIKSGLVPRQHRPESIGALKAGSR